MKHVQRIYFNAVAARDGLQNEPRFIATDDKGARVNALGECGYTTGMAHSGARQHYQINSCKRPSCLQKKTFLITYF